MPGPLEVAEHHHAQRHLLDHAVFSRRLDDVSHGELVLHQDEETGDDVADQALSAEGDGESQDTGTGQDWRDVDEGIEGEEHRYGDDGHPAYAPEQLGYGTTPFFPDGSDGVVTVVHRLLDSPSGELDRAKRQPGEQPDTEYTAASPNDELSPSI